MILMPSPQAVQSEQMLNQLKAMIARYRNGAPLFASEGSLARSN